jgi:hypothetical protein
VESVPQGGQEVCGDLPSSELNVKRKAYHVNLEYESSDEAAYTPASLSATSAAAVRHSVYLSCTDEEEGMLRTLLQWSYQAGGADLGHAQSLDRMHIPTCCCIASIQLSQSVHDTSGLHVTA